MTKETLFQNNIKVLSRYIPQPAAIRFSEWILTYKISLRITRDRCTKLGDYSPKSAKGVPSITINHNLNPYAFLITLVHEFAHHFNYLKHGLNVEPHGHEWKREYAVLLSEFMRMDIFPPDLLHALKKHIQNPPASSCADPFLQKILSFYDEDDGSIPIEHLPVNALFEFRNKVYKKEQLRRKRILCTCRETRKQYLFQPGVKVFPLEG
ncbi:MAG: SprT-like domain-containing protein [Bacteroidia bacterium]|nr:SprT-like domain-containing protein [Bacteroidia bacterium]